MAPTGSSIVLDNTTGGSQSTPIFFGRALILTALPGIAVVIDKLLPRKTRPYPGPEPGGHWHRPRIPPEG